MMKAEKLSVGYGRKIVVDDIEFEISGGEIITLIGPNGVGKSTILKTITTRLKELGGVVCVDEMPIHQYEKKELAKKMAVMLTGRRETELMTCYDVCALGRYPFTGAMGILSENDKKIVERSLEMTGMTEFADSYFDRISDGQKQRILLASAICQQPRILVLDEPVTFLDIRHKLEFMNMIQQLAREEKVAVIMSLHELELAQKVSDRIICIRDKRADRTGTPQEIFSGSYISELYDIGNSSFSDHYCSSELSKPQGNADAFIIGGGGYGLDLYRHFQRNGRAFYCGIIYENDIEYPCASALSERVFSVSPFDELSNETYESARQQMLSCRDVYCTVKKFGVLNEFNRKLMEEAKKNKLLRDIVI